MVEICQGVYGKELRGSCPLPPNSSWKALRSHFNWHTKMFVLLPREFFFILNYTLIFLNGSQHVLNVAQGPSGTLEGKNWDRVSSTEKWKHGILKKPIFIGMKSHEGLVETGRGFTLAVHMYSPQFYSPTTAAGQSRQREPSVITRCSIWPTTFRCRGRESFSPSCLWDLTCSLSLQQRGR